MFDENFQQVLSPPRLAQSNIYARALRETGHRIERRAHQDVGQALVLNRRIGPMNVRLLPGGIVWHHAVGSADRVDFLCALLKSAGHDVLLMNCMSPPDTACLQMAGAMPIQVGRYEAVLDLSADQDIRLSRMHGKFRNRVRHAQNLGLNIIHRPFDPKRDRGFIERERRQRQERGYSDLPVAFTVALATQASQDARIFIASRNGQNSAAMLFLRHQGAVTYHIGQTTDFGRQVSAHSLLLWEASNWFALQGDLRMDLGMIDTETGDGLARFKLGIGATPVSTGATFLYSTLTKPLVRLVAFIQRHTAARAAEGQSGPSFR